MIEVAVETFSSVISAALSSLKLLSSIHLRTLVLMFPLAIKLPSKQCGRVEQRTASCQNFHERPLYPL